MKRLIIFIFSFLILTSVEAQRKKGTEKVKPKRVEEVGNKVVGIHAGISLTGLAYEALERDDDTVKYTTSVKPAFQLTYDYFYSNKITVGLFTSIQPYRVDISYWQYGDTVNPKTIEDLQAKMHRFYIGGKLLYHFKNTEKIDIYSGVRGGLLFWNKKLPSTDPAFVTSFEDEILMMNRPALGIIPLGFRIKFTPQFAANIEFNASAPHLFSFGGCYTF